jgi:hypothetical protein
MKLHHDQDLSSFGNLSTYQLKQIFLHIESWTVGWIVSGFLLESVLMIHWVAWDATSACIAFS